MKISFLLEPGYPIDLFNGSRIIGSFSNDILGPGVVISSLGAEFMCAAEFFVFAFGEGVSFNWVNDTSVTLLLVKARLLRLFLSIICGVGFEPRFKSLASSLLRTWVCTDIFFLGLGLSSDVKTVVSPFISDLAAALDACLRRTSGARERRVDFKDRGDWLERLTLGDEPLTFALLVGLFSGVL